MDYLINFIIYKKNRAWSAKLLFFKIKETNAEIIILVRTLLMDFGVTFIY